jgi:hypothetical protein
MNRRWVFVISALAACGLSYVALRNTSESDADARQAERRKTASDLEAAGREEFKKLAYTDLSSFASIADVRELLDRMSLNGSPPMGTGTVDQVLDEAAEFIYYRFVTHDAAEFRRWRQATGAQPVPLETMVREKLPPKAYDYYTGEPMPTGASLEQVFDRLWSASTIVPRCKAVRISSERKGLAAAFGVLTRSDEQRVPIGGEMAGEVWQGSISVSLPSWWHAQLSQGDLLHRYGRIPYADVGMVMEFENGARYPVELTFYWDESTRLWRLEFVNLYNSREFGGFVY